MWLRVDTSVDCCENVSESLGSIRRWEFIVYLSEYWLLKKDSAPLSEVALKTEHLTLLVTML